MSLKQKEEKYLKYLMEIIDKKLLDSVSEKAKASERLRMNYNFHESLEDKCHRMLNAVEPGTQVPIHRHPTKDESFVVLRGRGYWMIERWKSMRL